MARLTTSTTARLVERACAGALGVVLTATLVGQAIPAEAEHRGGRPEVEKARPLDLSPIRARKMPENKEYTAAAARSLQMQNRPVTWPKVGHVTVGAPGRAKARLDRLTVLSENTGQATDVQVLSQAASRKIGVAGVLYKVTPAPAGNRGKLIVTTDYAQFAHAYGADWRGRLRAYSFPACILTTPKRPACQVADLIPTKNDVGRSTLTATLAPSRDAAPRVLALTAVAASASGTGDFSATPLAASSSWSAGGSSGDFSWAYTMRAVPANNGPSPQLGISYSSQSVDGRTAATNNQTSQLGEGFSLANSFIERGYVTCKDDGQAGKFDLCWKTDNATITLNGQANELIKTADGTWRLASDNGTRIRRLTSTSTYNLDNDKEYWEATDPNGTKYFFGRTTSTGQTGDTGSVWYAPVFGDDSGEPCHNSTFATSVCNQAWRWNLDYVVDPNGNAMSLWYTPEYNYYARNKVASPGVKYTRGGRLDSVHYGLRDPGTNTNPPFKVTYEYGERCLQATGCDTYSKAKWPDTPYDQICASGAACTGKFAPTFFTRFRVKSVTTSIRKAGAYSPVESWAFTHKFLDSGTAADGTLWLERITHKGLAGGTVTTPDVVMSAGAYANRVDSPTDGIDSLPRFRIRTLQSESGAVTTVNYSDAECTATNKPASPDNNTMRCFPQKWTPEGNTSPRTDWFHKYVVTSVVDADLTGLAPPVTTSYAYLGGTAWAYEDSKLISEDYRTWSQWRGYEKVKTVSGTAGFTDKQSQEITTYFRGMNGDRQTSGTPRSVSTPASDGSQIVDRRELAGVLRETLVYTEEGGTISAGTINTPWVKVVAGSGQKTAAFVKSAKQETRALLSDGSWQRRTVTNAFDDATGLATRVSDTGDLADPEDQTCVATSYVDAMTPTGVWKVGYPARIVTSKGLCDANALNPTESNAISDVRKRYDSQAQGTILTGKGLVTEVDRLKGYAGNQPQYQLVNKATYDSFGRPLTLITPSAQTDASTRQTSMAYSMSADGTLIGTTKTLDVGGKAFTTIKVMDPAWGSPTKITDANGKFTTAAYDALGRVVSVWKANRATTATPSTKYAYSMSQTGATAVKTSTLNRDGSGYVESVQVYDSLLRERQIQTQSPTGGRIISGTAYDGRGLPYRTFGDVYATGVPAAELVQFDEGSVPTMTKTTFDGESRPTKETLLTFNTERWSSTTSYAGIDKTTFTPPNGAPATTAYTDISGRTVRSIEHGTPDLVTSTAYDFRGNLSKIVSPGGTWTYTYDLRGRKIATSDPDAGLTSQTFTENDLVKTSTDGNGKTVLTTYDNLDRPTASYEGATVDAAKQLSGWTYDSPAKGYLATETRFVGGSNGDKFVRTVLGYNALYNPSEIRFAITKGSASDLLQGFPTTTTFTRSTVYNLDQSVDVDYLPKVAVGAQAALSAEPIQYGYNSLGMPKSMTGRSGILQDVVYDQTGQVQQYVLGTGPSTQIYVSSDYDQGTGRLTRSLVTSSSSNQVISDRKYTYDDAGNPTKEADTATGDVQCFGYDDHRRLANAWTPGNADCSSSPSQESIGGPAPYWQSWTFTDNGLRKTQNSATPTSLITDTYDYPGQGVLHQNFASKVTRTGSGAPIQLDYEPDSGGNTASRPVPNPGSGAQTLTWDAEGNLSKLTDSGGETRYVYGVDGNLLFRDEPDAKVLVYGETEIRMAKSTGQLTANRTYATPAGSAATRSSDTQIDFLVSDPHNTAVAAIDGTTLNPTRRFQTPYGERRGNSPAAWPDQHGFLGKIEDPRTGLVSVGAREYDAATGRFVSVDPVLDPSSPAQMLGYAYANNNPKAFSDPTGLWPNFDFGALVDALKDKKPDPPKPTKKHKHRTIPIHGNPLSDGRPYGSPPINPPYYGEGGGLGDALGWLVDKRHTITEVVGYIPGPGDAVDVLDVVMYSFEGDFGNAAISGVAAFPVIGSPIKSAIKHGDEVADGVASLTKHSDEAADAAKAADNVLPPLPKALSGGKQDTHVYYGIDKKTGKPEYAGISNNPERRSGEHKDRFRGLTQITSSPLTRGQARAVEEALILRNAHKFSNVRHEISIKHDWYGDAVQWGEAWLKQNGVP